MENLFPGSEIELAPGDGNYNLATRNLSFYE